LQRDWTQVDLRFYQRQASTTSKALVAPLHVRPAGQEGDNTASKVIQRFAQSLARGILFAIPMKPSTTQALFGIQGKRKNAKQNQGSTPSVSFTLRECFAAIGIYLLVGIGAYSLLMEHWSLVDAVYFSIVTFTTVGYGDIGPHTPASKLFTCLFSLGGIAVLGAALASIGARFVEAELHAIKAAQTLSRKRAIKFFDRLPKIVGRNGKKKQHTSTNSTVTAVVPFNATATKATGELVVPPRRKTISATVRSVVLNLIPSLTLLVIGGIAMGRLEGWSVMDSIYYSVITCGTVGYGDFSPISQRARLWAIIFIPFAVASGGEILGTVASAILEQRRARVYDNLMTRDFTIDHIKEMDKDGDGEVSRLEYMEFMLVEMKLVDKSVIDELREQFDRLDMTMSDSLTKQDLILMAKLRRSQHENRTIPEMNGVP
jgi:hypothetical protein